MKAYFGEETKKALNNFPFSTHSVKMEFILSIVKIKKAAALANFKAGNLSLNVSLAIVKAADEVLSGKWHNQFPLFSFQGGAGTAINMNVNEVLANRATEILKTLTPNPSPARGEGKEVVVHPNDHVNRSQSTNDVNPSAIKIASIQLVIKLDQSLSALVKAFDIKAKSFSKTIKLGRTHMQDAVPTTLGAEFESFSESLKNHQQNLRHVSLSLNALNLGGTAIGNSVNANPKYIQEVYRGLNKITKGNFRPAKNLMSKTSDQTDFLIISQSITALCATLSKIANDFKFMSSGPKGGIGELVLPELQKGSSIMPGKVNPVMPETLNQLYYLVSGNNVTIEKAVEGAQMELGVMLPIIADRLIESLSLTAETIKQFEKLCVLKLRADVKKCKEHLENSTAFATYLTPKFGYDKISELVKKTVNENRSFREIVTESGLMNEKDWKLMVKNLLK